MRYSAAASLLLLSWMFALAEGSASYEPKNVSAAWKNHFNAFGAQDLDQIMLDYATVC